MNRALIFLTIVFMALTMRVCSAQEPNFDDIFDSADDEFKEMKRKADEEFAQMKKSVDDEFGDLLENAWREFELARGIERDDTPKPDKPPVAHPEKEPKKPLPPPEEIPVEQPKPAPRDITPPPPKEPEKPAPEPPKPADTISFDFYEVRITLAYDPRWKMNVADNEASPETISRYWEYFSKTNFKPFLTQAQYAKEQIGLNDWGYCRLLHTFAGELYPRQTIERPLFIWFMLVQSGYDARVGYSENNIYVLVPSSQIIYQAPYYELGTEKYYITNLGGMYGSLKSLFTYEGKHREATKRIDFTVAVSPSIGKNPLRKSFAFRYGDEHKVNVDINRNIIDFYEYYPQIDLDVYFHAALSSETDGTLLAGLKPLIRGKSEQDAVNIILRFVQTALEYQTDGEQFNEENYLFPEESLYYPYCDCEDRSFLFSYLVTNLLGLDTVGLEYPGHVATAVKFSTDVPGDAVIIGNNRYVICDPTYINANIGECMPHLKKVTPRVISTRREM